MDKERNISILIKALRIFAPIYFIFFSFLRCYLEARMSVNDFFSYYALFHHIFWNTTTVFFIILIVHLILNVPVERLIWLMYGVTLMAVPLFYSICTGQKLQLGYLRGSFWTILGHIFSFCLTFQKNIPLTIELFIIFFFVFFLGYYYSRSWRRSFLAALTVHITGNVIAIHWFGVYPNTKALFPVVTQWSNHPLLSVIYLHTATFLILLLFMRSGVFSIEKRKWIISFLFAAGSSVIYIIIAYITGLFVNSFDIVMSSLPVGFLLFIISRILQRNSGKISIYIWLILILLFLMQMAVMGPIYCHKEDLLTKHKKHISIFQDRYYGMVQNKIIQVIFPVL